VALFSIRSNESTLTISSKGAYVTEWSIAGKNVLLPGNLERPTRGGMAIMIPYANRVRDGEYEFEGVRYVLPRNEEGHAIHGLVLNDEWELLELGPSEIEFKHVLNHPGYPTELTSVVKYALGEREFRTDLIIRNTGSRTAPLVVGAHPYFIVSPDWRIRVDGEVRICVMSDKIPTGELLPYDIDNTSKREFDDCFLIGNAEVTLESSYSTIKMVRRNMPYTQIYTGIPGSIAIEPMSGAPDAYHNGLGLIVIRPGETKTFSFTIKVLRI